jgi:hypothetical protein
MIAFCSCANRNALFFASMLLSKAKTSNPFDEAYIEFLPSPTAGKSILLFGTSANCALKN